mgnify:CR=1 FL=1
MNRKTVKRQTFALDGGTYMYRITEASIRRYEEANATPISAYMTMLQVVRALYHMTCMLPAGYNEQAFIDATRKARSTLVHRMGNTPSGAYVPSWSPPAGNSSEWR